MSRWNLYGFLLLTLASLLVYGFATEQSQTLDPKGLRDMLVQLGYEVKDLNTEVGKEKYSSDFKTTNLNIPVGFEISPSKNYVWLTVHLGPMPTDSPSMPLELLKQNAKLQPTFFYVTSKDNLMAALPVENRGITNAVLKQRVESLVNNVDTSRTVWQKQ